MSKPEGLVRSVSTENINEAIALRAAAETITGETKQHAEKIVEGAVEFVQQEEALGLGKDHLFWSEEGRWGEHKLGRHLGDRVATVLQVCVPPMRAAAKSLGTKFYSAETIDLVLQHVTVIEILSQMNKENEPLSRLPGLTAVSPDYLERIKFLGSKFPKIHWQITEIQGNPRSPGLQEELDITLRARGKEEAFIDALGRTFMEASPKSGYGS